MGFREAFWTPGGVSSMLLGYANVLHGILFGVLFVAVRLFVTWLDVCVTWTPDRY